MPDRPEIMPDKVQEAPRMSDAAQKVVQTPEEKLSSFVHKLTEAADQRAVMMDSNGQSWKANRLALESVGINAPRGNASDIEKIPGMDRLPSGVPPQPGDVYTTGADAKHPNGYSFIVNAEGKAASDHFAKVPNLNDYTDVKHFRKSNE